MRDKFGLDFRIVDSSMMKDLRRKRGIHVNPWTHFPRLITSIDFIARNEGCLNAATQTQWDMVVVDEAQWTGESFDRFSPLTLRR